MPKQALRIRLPWDRYVYQEGHARRAVRFLRRLRASHPESLIVIWDNGPAHGGASLRTYLTTPDLRLIRLPAYLALV